MADIIIASRPTFPGEELRVTVSAFRGQDYIHVRKYFQNDQGTMQPGKGIAFRVEALPWVMNALRTAEAELLRTGKLLPEDFSNDGLDPPAAA
jgi:hypothetical protein